MCNAQSNNRKWQASAAVQVCYGPGDGTITSGGYDQAVRVWDCRSRSYDAIQTMKPFGDSVTSVCMTDRCMRACLRACMRVCVRVFVCVWLDELLNPHMMCDWISPKQAAKLS